MSTELLLAVALLGAPEQYRDAPIAAISPAPLTGQQLQDMYHQQIRRTARIRDVVPADVVPDLVVLHVALQHKVDIPGSELVRMRRHTEDRLERVEERLRRDRYRLQQELQRAQRRQQTTGAVGGGSVGVQQELANAQALIDLITETIQPESWEINGGRGTIRYFAPLHVLVVRNNQRAHEELGGALGGR
jgi:hypothetical protein